MMMFGERATNRGAGGNHKGGLRGGLPLH